MSTLFVVLFLLSLIFLVIGLIKPSIFHKKEGDKLKFTRKRVGLGLGILTLIFFILIGLTAPKVKNEQLKSEPSTTPSVSSTPTSAPTQEPSKAPVVQKQATPKPTATSTSKQPDVPTEYKSALSQATSYANTMHMSKKGVYNQLVSEYGGKFSPAAAQYGIDNVKADWNANALAKAKTYQDTMHMSPASIHDQLISEYGEKFTQAEADYAIQHLND